MRSQAVETQLCQLRADSCSPDKSKDESKWPCSKWSNKRCLACSLSARGNSQSFRNAVGSRSARLFSFQRQMKTVLYSFVEWCSVVFSLFRCFSCASCQVVFFCDVFYCLFNYFVSFRLILLCCGMGEGWHSATLQNTSILRKIPLGVNNLLYYNLKSKQTHRYWSIFLSCKS